VLLPLLFVWKQDFFAWRWRASLTLHLQGLYCRNIGAICPKSQAPLLQVGLDNRVCHNWFYGGINMCDMISSVAVLRSSTAGLAACFVNTTVSFSIRTLSAFES